MAGTDDRVAIDVRVHGLAPGGDAIGRQVGGASDGRATFVALAAPGELVRARVRREKARVAWGELVSITEPGADRVPPPCPYFGACGGCQWQHVSLDAQRVAKRAIVARALGVPIDSIEAPVPAGAAYRDRARVAVGTAGEVGFRHRGEHRIVDVEACLLLAPAAARAFAGIRGIASTWPAGTEIDLQAGHDGVHVVVRAADARVPTSAAGLFAAWQSLGIAGVRIGGTGKVDDTGGASDVDVSEPGGPPLRIPASGFAQVGRAANAALVRAVLDAVGDDPGAVLELYAGSGNFTRHLVSKSRRVLASDGDPSAVERGRRNVPAATWIRRPSDAASASEADTVVLDPPRAGLDDEHRRAAITARRRIVYVSCDIQTLARDAALLSQSGFVLRHAIAFDLMPHTFHIEVVATFERS